MRRSEWQSRKIAGALVTPLGSLRNFFDTLPRGARIDQRLNMVCCWSCNAVTALSAVYETAAKLPRPAAKKPRPRFTICHEIMREGSEVHCAVPIAAVAQERFAISAAGFTVGRNAGT